MNYNLALDQTLELKTTINQAEYPITVDFNFPYDGDMYYFNFKCTSVYSSTWIYVIRNCMTDSWTPYQYLIGVPSDQIKVWQITRTQTSLLVVCDGVTVLDFNFETDYRDGYSNCHSLWTRYSTSIVFRWDGGMYGSNGYLFMRTNARGKWKSILIFIRQSRLQKFLSTKVKFEH